MKRFLFPLAVAGLAVGCDGDAPMVMEPLAPAFGVVQSGGSCRGVQGVIQADASPTNAFGMIYGDIVWTIESTVVHLPPIRRVTNRITLIQGATGNLVSHGVLDLTTLRTDFDYEGVVCVPSSL